MVNSAGKGGRSTYRERHRAARRREFLDVAREIVNTSGLDALTMQGVTDVVGSSTGGIYVYFPTRDDLTAALQQEAFEVMATSYLQGQASLDAHLASAGGGDAEAALARAVAVGRFWIESERTLPNEVELTRRLIAGAGTTPTTGSGIPLAALGLIDHGRQRLDAAVDAGALGPGNAGERGVMLVAAITGVLLTSKLGGWDHDLFDGHRLARELMDHIFVGWGANREALEAASTRLDDFSRHHELAPAVTPTDGN